MESVRGYYDGKLVHPIEPVKAPTNARVIITFLDGETASRAVSQSRLEDVAGCLKYDGPAKTLEEMEDGIRRGAAESGR